MDLNGDKKVDTIDYTLLQRYILGIISSFPVEEMNPTDPKDDDAWKENTGTIELGSRITVSGEGISV